MCRARWQDGADALLPGEPGARCGRSQARGGHGREDAGRVSVDGSEQRPVHVGLRERLSGEGILGSRHSSVDTFGKPPGYGTVISSVGLTVLPNLVANRIGVLRVFLISLYRNIGKGHRNKQTKTNKTVILI